MILLNGKFIKEQMEQVKQDIVVAFRDGECEEYIDAIGYQLGSGFIGVISKEGITTITTSDLVLEVVITPKGE